MRRQVYIVDDDDAVRATLEILLSQQPNLDVASFGSGEDFLARAGDLPRGVLLLDFNMPGADGLDVLRDVNAMGDGRFAAIVVTGDGSVARAVAAMKAGAFDFIQKPLDAEKLLAIIDEAFDRLVEEAVASACRRRAQDRIAALSARERDVLGGLIDGESNKVVAHRLEISPRTVEIYRANLMTKLGAQSLPDVLRVAFAAGIVPP